MKTKLKTFFGKIFFDENKTKKVKNSCLKENYTKKKKIIQKIKKQK